MAHLAHPLLWLHCVGYLALFNKISGLWLPNSYIMNIHKGVFFAINFLQYFPPVMVYHARVGHSSQYERGARMAPVVLEPFPWTKV